MVENKEENKEEIKKEDKQVSQFIGNGCIEALNFRMNEEEHASRLYKSMAIWFRHKGYNGFAKYWHSWSLEELDHASWACEYLLDLSIKPEVRELKAVENNFDSVKDILEQTLEAEVEITKQCKKLAERANDKPDHMLFNLAQRYLSEQQEEINKITNILSKLEAFGEDGIVLMELDEQMYEDEL